MRSRDVLLRGASSVSAQMPAGAVAWYTAYDNTYLKVNTDGTGGNVAPGGMVGRWNDRSGSGNHLPAYSSTRGPVWNGVQGCDFPWKVTGGTLVSGVASSSLAVSLTRGNTSGGMIVWSGATQETPYFSYGPHTGGTILAIMTGTGSSGTQTPNRGYFNGAAILNTGTRGTSRKSVVLWRNDGTNFNIWVDGQMSTHTGVSAGTSTGLALGLYLNGGGRAGVRVIEAAFYNSAMSDANMTALGAYLRAQVGTAGDATRTVEVFGDSLTVGVGSQTGRPWHWRTDIIANRATSLWRSSGFDGGFLYSNPSISAAQLVAGKGSAEGVVILWIGTNDVSSGGQTGAQWSAKMVTLSNTCRASGMKVIACTLQHFATNNTERINGNNALLAASSSFDAIARLDTVLPDASDTSLYASDGVHLLDAGYDLVATEVQSKLAAV